MIPDFIVPYDGCLKNSNDLLNICGDSNIGLDIGSNETINFKSSSKSNFICYYSIRKIMNNNNDIKISVYKEGNEKIYFTMVFVIYYNYAQIRITTLSDMVTYSNFFWLNESKVEKISLFINILSFESSSYERQQASANLQYLLTVDEASLSCLQISRLPSLSTSIALIIWRILVTLTDMIVSL